ncbi:MAG TPA: hypothetical protein VGL97_20955 [Bryobacteraceae bacterium]
MPKRWLQSVVLVLVAALLAGSQCYASCLASACAKTSHCHHEKTASHCPHQHSAINSADSVTANHLEPFAFSAPAFQITPQPLLIAPTLNFRIQTERSAPPGLGTTLRI